MLQSRGDRVRIQGDINVTPLVDVCLVLLVIFMIVTPMLAPGRPVNLPTAMNPDVKPDEERGATITLMPDGSIYLQNTGLPIEALQEELASKLKSGAVPVYLRADRGQAFGDVKKILAAVERAGSKEVQLSVQHVDVAGRPVTGAQNDRASDREGR